MKTNRILRTVLLVSGLLLVGVTVWAQPFPSRPVKLVVGYPAGGGADAVARALVNPLSQQLGQPVVVENRPGAAGGIAADAVARSPADGHTLLIADRGILVFNLGLFKTLPYNPERDFAPVGTVVMSHFVMVAPASAGRSSVSRLIADAKTSPGKLNYAATATGSTAAMEAFKRQAGVDIVSVPYKGAAPALTAVLAGEVDTMLVDVMSALPHIRAGKLLALGVTSAQRLPWLPDVPTLAESGLAGYEGLTWVGLLAPAGTPSDVVQRLHSALAAALKAPEVTQRYEGNGLQVMPGTPAFLAQRMKDEQAVWPKRLRDWGLAQE